MKAILSLPCRLSPELIQTAHSDHVNGLAFPSAYSEVFATCANGGVRVWHLDGCRELLRIALPNLECKCVAFSPVSTPFALESCSSLKLIELWQRAAAALDWLRAPMQSITAEFVVTIVWWYPQCDARFDTAP